MPNRAFSLIELLIAIAIGSLIIYAAYASFRLTAQTITLSKRMSVENRLIQAGIIEAVEDIDFWVSHDHPVDASQQRMRGTGTIGGDTFDIPPDLLASHMPWTPFSVSMKTALNNGTAFDPANPMAAHDPETWYRGNFAQRMQTPNRISVAKPGPEKPFDPSSMSDFGRYGIFAGVDARPTLNGRTSYSVDKFPHSPITNGAYGTVDVRFVKRDNQVMYLRHALGLYGVQDYLPPDTQFAYYKNDEIFEWRMKNFWEWSWTGEVWGRIERGRDGFDGAMLTRSPWSGYMYEGGPNSNWNNWTVVDQHHRQMPRRTEWWHRVPLYDFNRTISYSRQLLTDARPAGWPQVNFSTQRYMYRGTFMDICRVAFTDTDKGVSKAIFFNVFGTSFRGARQQRNPTGGYARWYMPEAERARSPSTYSASGLNIPVNDPNLDSIGSPLPAAP